MGSRVLAGRQRAGTGRRGPEGEVMAARHNHTIHRHHAHFGWDNALEPVLTVAPGQSVELHTVDSSGGQLPCNASPADLAQLDFARVNPVTGPVRIDGAEPG